MKRMCRLLAALLALLLPLAAAAQEVYPTIEEAKVAESKRSESGMVRVLLSSLGKPTRLTLTLEGAYILNNSPDMRFDSGAQLILSASGADIWLTVGGMRLNMGESLTLNRTRSEGMSAMRIKESEKDTLYPGDLCVSAADGALRSVLHLQMEDYLCGVIAYEMSDAWPLEALKAQAVAARSYAMQKISASASRDYDLVDTTADQVFKGYDPSFGFVEQAVRETRGIVGTYKGEYAIAFYTASNGGETALPSDVWGGGGDYGYLERRSDPFDLESKNAIVKSVSFAPGADDLPQLRQMLQEALLNAYPDYEDPELHEILEITPTDPVAEGSLMCKKLRFTLSASAITDTLGPAEGDPGAILPATEQQSANLALFAIDGLRRLLLQAPYESGRRRTMLSEPFTVELDTYEQIKRGLNIGINSADYELVSVEKGIFDYTISLRRFGHGVGMSQRGAQRMANAHGMSYLQILGFYYPGMSLERIDWDVPELPALEPLSESVLGASIAPTPAPTLAPLPPLEAGEKYARIRLGDDGSQMNLRAQPSTSAQIVTKLPDGTRLIIDAEVNAEGWVSVHTAEYSGYAKLDYLVAE